MLLFFTCDGGMVQLMNKKTSADYQRAFRQRLREQGLKKREIWIRPEHEKLLGDIEARLRHPAVMAAGEVVMENERDSWHIEALREALALQPLFRDGRATLERIDGLEPSLLVIMHDYGDLPVYLGLSGAQIMVEAVLWAADMVRDKAAFHEAVLATHKFFPLSTISLEHDSSGEAYYGMFGALAATSSITDILIEIEMLAANVIEAAQAYGEFLQAGEQ